MGAVRGWPLLGWVVPSPIVVQARLQGTGAQDWAQAIVVTSGSIRVQAAQRLGVGQGWPEPLCQAGGCGWHLPGSRWSWQLTCQKDE